MAVGLPRRVVLRGLHDPSTSSRSEASLRQQAVSYLVFVCCIPPFYVLRVNLIKRLFCRFGEADRTYYIFDCFVVHEGIATAGDKIDLYCVFRLRASTEWFKFFVCSLHKALESDNA